MAMTIERQLDLFGNKSGGAEEESILPLSIEVKRVIDIMRECERSLSFFVVDCGLSPGEREALRRAASALERQLKGVVKDA